jgi:hypothetical protein
VQLLNINNAIDSTVLSAFDLPGLAGRFLLFSLFIHNSYIYAFIIILLIYLVQLLLLFILRILVDIATHEYFILLVVV